MANKRRSVKTRKAVKKKEAGTGKKRDDSSSKEMDKWQSGEYF